MEFLIKDMIEQLRKKKEHEFRLIEKYKSGRLNDLILISSGKIMEIDAFIQSLEEMLAYHSKLVH